MRLFSLNIAFLGRTHPTGEHTMAIRETHWVGPSSVCAPSVLLGGWVLAPPPGILGWHLSWLCCVCSVSRRTPAHLHSAPCGWAPAGGLLLHLLLISRRDGQCLPCSHALASPADLSWALAKPQQEADAGTSATGKRVGAQSGVPGSTARSRRQGGQAQNWAGVQAAAPRLTLRLPH